MGSLTTLTTDLRAPDGFQKAPLWGKTPCRLPEPTLDALGPRMSLGEQTLIPWHQAGNLGSGTLRGEKARRSKAMQVKPYDVRNCGRYLEEAHPDKLLPFKFHMMRSMNLLKLQQRKSGEHTIPPMVSEGDITGIQGFYCLGFWAPFI